MIHNIFINPDTHRRDVVGETSHPVRLPVPGNAVSEIPEGYIYFFDRRRDVESEKISQTNNF
jgi:hypothetical protein